MLGKNAGQADEVRHVQIVPTGVHHPGPRAVGRGDLHGRGIREAGLFGHRQSIQLGAKHDNGPAAILQDADDPVAADAGRYLEADGLELSGDARCRFHFFKRNFRMAMKMFVERNELVDLLLSPAVHICSRGDAGERADDDGRRQKAFDDRRMH
jgi:hypothetical protein